jgi:hypothetical protein
MRPFNTHSQGGNEMTVDLLTNDSRTLTCKHLPALPPVVSDWQQSCQQPRCPHYCRGECWNPDRQGAAAACPFDGEELPLEDTDALAAEDGPSLTTRGVPKKG